MEPQGDSGERMIRVQHRFPRGDLGDENRGIGVFQE